MPKPPISQTWLSSCSVSCEEDPSTGHCLAHLIAPHWELAKTHFGWHPQNDVESLLTIPSNTIVDLCFHGWFWQQRLVSRKLQISQKPLMELLGWHKDNHCCKRRRWSSFLHLSETPIMLLYWDQIQNFIKKTNNNNIQCESKKNCLQKNFTNANKLFFQMREKVF